MRRFIKLMATFYTISFVAMIVYLTSPNNLTVHAVE